MLCHMLDPRRAESADAQPPTLAQLALPPRPKLSFGRWLVMHVFYIDTMICPVYSIGALFHVITSTMYLVTAQAPIAPDEVWKLVAYWLPLMVIKAAVTTQTARATNPSTLNSGPPPMMLVQVSCQITALPHVQLAVQWNAQQAWMG